MAIHVSISSMIKESLVEMFLVAKYSIEFQKDSTVWGSDGCYGYPAAVLLLSIVDSIGSFVIDGGNVEKHFNILNHKDYYDLNLESKDIKDIYEQYRCLLVHNGVMAVNVVLAIGGLNSEVFQRRGGKSYLNLLPLLTKTQFVLLRFFESSDILVNNSKNLQNILKK